jgi:hypothetical protein
MMRIALLAVLAVVDYIRTHFGNDYPDKTDPAAAKASRP